MNRLLLMLHLMIILASSCGREALYQNYFGETQGTTFNILYQEKPFLNINATNKAIDSRLSEIDRTFSLYNSGSLLSAINRNEEISVDSLFTELFTLSMNISELTGGLYDPTVGPLVRAWGFGPDAIRNFDPTLVDSLMNLVGFRKVRIEDGCLMKDNPGICLDMNAIAQGFTVDLICRLLDELGIRSYLVEIGGEVRAKGMRGDRLWRVGVDRPVDGNIYPGRDLAAIIELDNEALATSGNYRRFYVEDGVKYSHTINPLTGMPARNRILSATVISDNAATADAFATACMVAGPAGAMEMINRYDFLEGYLIYSGDAGEFLTWTSAGLTGRLKEE
ncbi:MAG: FAD:protein FMN transferase [Bacteroidales bacterium]|jgi:thiamine biosynthesis lipoprotein|nr:FAD:protein FMN transferase [Bacteroidales bacterium]